MSSDFNLKKGPAATHQAISIRQLTRDELTEHIEEFVAIAVDVPGEYWQADHFLVDLPRKWVLSSAVWQAKKPIGYAIVSERAPRHAHLHHFMIAHDFRGSGIGHQLVSFMVTRARAFNYNVVTLKVATDNLRALDFYHRVRFETDHTADGAVLCRRNLDAR